MVWFFNTQENPTPLFPTPYCGQPYVTEEIDHFLWVGTIKAHNDLCMNVNIPFVFLHLPTELSASLRVMLKRHTAVCNSKVAYYSRYMNTETAIPQSRDTVKR